MIALFCDIDGVLNSWMSIVRYGTPRRFSPAAVRDIKGIITRFGARLVWSTAWRHGSDFPHEIVRLCVAACPEDRGFWENRMHHRTGSHPAGRGMEIFDWLDANPYIDDYHIIDDDVGDILGMHAKERVTKTNMFSGLQVWHTSRVHSELSKPLCYKSLFK